MTNPETVAEKLTSAVCAARAAALLDKSGVEATPEFAQVRVDAARVWIELGYHISEKVAFQSATLPA